MEGALGVILPGSAGIPAQAALDLNKRKRREFEQKIAKYAKGWSGLLDTTIFVPRVSS